MIILSVYTLRIWLYITLYRNASKIMILIYIHNYINRMRLITGCASEKNIGWSHFSKKSLRNYTSTYENGYIFYSDLEQHTLVAFSRFEGSVQLQIEAAGKILVWSVTFGLKSVENSFELDSFFELTTPNTHL